METIIQAAREAQALWSAGVVMKAANRSYHAGQTALAVKGALAHADHFLFRLPGDAQRRIAEAQWAAYVEVLTVEAARNLEVAS